MYGQVMFTRCSQKPGEKGEVRGQSFTPSCRHNLRCQMVSACYGWVASWKTMEVMAWRKALQIFLWKREPEGKKELFGSVSFPYMEKPDKMFWFSGALENSDGNQDHTHQAGIRDEDPPGRWAPRQLSSEPDCILHPQQKLIVFSIKHLSSFTATLNCTPK